MKINSFNNPLINDFAKEFGVLLSIRISLYFTKFFKEGETEFVNQFIACPHEEELDYEFVEEMAKARHHFEDNLKTGFIDVELDGISINKNGLIQYHMSIFLGDIDSDEGHDYASFIFDGKELSFNDPMINDSMENFNDKIWLRSIRKIQKQISFGTLQIN